MKNKFNLKKYAVCLLFAIAASSCNSIVNPVSEDDLIGKHSVTVEYDSKEKDLDFMFDLENFAEATEFEFSKSGILDCIFEGDPMGTGVNYGLSMNSIKWELDKNVIIFTTPSEPSNSIKRVSIEKDAGKIVLKTDNVVYILKKK